MAIKLTIIRHAPTRYNKINKFMGTLDIEPDTIPTEALNNAISYLNNVEGIAAIYSSPLQRTLKTAQEINQFNYDIIIDNRLMERGLGDWEGMYKADVKSKYINAFKNDVMDFYHTPENGENYIDFVKRISDFLIDIFDSNKNYIIVTHNGVFRVIKSLLTGVALSTVFSEFEPFLTPQTFEFNEEIVKQIKENPFYSMDNN